jgi:cobalt-zinc-cadmium efflux system membrane fusion protein
MKSIINIGIVASISLLIVACGSGETAKPTVEEHHENLNIVELTAEQFKTVNVQFGQVELKSLSGTIKVNGTLDVPPQNLVSISSSFGGTVKSTSLLQGMKVKKGQEIATIQHPDYITFQQDYLDFKSQLEFLKSENERQQDLAKENINSKKIAQKAKSEYESMLAKVNGLKAKLQLLNISISKLEKGIIKSYISLISPISGYVTEINTNIGAVVSPTDILFKIADTEHLHAELTVYEKDIPKLHVGQKVRFKLVNEDKERYAEISLIGREINHERAVKVHCHLEQIDAELIPGMYLNALVESGSKNVTALPESAIVDFEGDKYIFIEREADHKNEHRFEMVPIKIGVSELGYVEVMLPSNLNFKKSKVVINGAYDVLSAMKNGEEEGGHAH